MTSRQSPAPEKASAANSADERRLAALEREIQRLRVAVAVRPASHAEEGQPDKGHLLNTQTGSEQSEATPRTPEEIEQAERRAEEARSEFLDGLSDKLATEAFDPSWRVENERTITRLIPERFGSDVTVDEVSCASTLCRARLTHPGSPRLPQDKLAMFFMDRESLGSMGIQLDTRADGVTTMYFVREDEP